jgi:hypothetical protein
MPLSEPMVAWQERFLATFDALEPARRKEVILALGARRLAELFDACAKNPPLALRDLVPLEVPALTEVVHEGKNSLPVFSRFQKRFCRPNDASQELWGYNEQTMRPVTGPGYFVVHHTDGGELAIDYRRLPPDKPSSWPPIRSNSNRLARFVFEGNVDILRGLRPGVTLGRVFKAGKAQDTWFALVRDVA